jgi:hypothetical protein
MQSPANNDLDCQEAFPKPAVAGMIQDCDDPATIKAVCASVQNHRPDCPPCGSNLEARIGLSGVSLFGSRLMVFADEFCVGIN